MNKPPTDDTKAPSRGAGARTGAGKSKEKSEVQLTKLQPETTKDTTQDSAAATKPKKHLGTVKSEEEETETTQPEDITKISLVFKKRKTCAGKDESKEESEVQLTKPQPEMETDTTQDSVTVKLEEETETTQPEDTTNSSFVSTKPRTGAGKDDLKEESEVELTKPQPEMESDTTQDSVTVKLEEETETTQPEDTKTSIVIKIIDKSSTSEVVNKLIKHLINHLKKKTTCFTTAEALRTGSYNENVEISKPDEFDVMLSIDVDRVDIKPFGDNGAFYRVAFKRGKNPLKKFRKGNILSARKMLRKFRHEVKKCVKAVPEWEVTRKKPGCPAVTMTTTVQSVIISLDVVLCIKVRKHWPDSTKQGFQIDKWLGTKEKKKHKKPPYYLVPKYEGSGEDKHEGVSAKDAWLVSFSHVDKGIMLIIRSEKTGCEREDQRCCRKDCLKLLKHLLSLLKEKEPSFEKFQSYQTKKTLLHACSSRVDDRDWSASSRSRCFKKLKTCAGKDESKEESEEELTKPQPETTKDTTQDSVTVKSEEETETWASVDSLLSTTLDKLRIKMIDISSTSEVVNKLIKHIIKHLKKKTNCFTKVEKLNTGSYYEKVKISKPDEFDVMLSIFVDRVDIEPFGDNGAFYSVAFKRGKNPLKKFRKGNILSARKMLRKFRHEVKKCVRAVPDWEVSMEKPGCPAVTMTTNVQSVLVSLDVVLCIKVRKHWPDSTKQGFQIDKWLGTKVKRDYKRQPYYFVPKYEGSGEDEHDGVSAKDAWRVSFSHVEKDILLKHGSDKKCCEREGQRCCRKDCLKLLKLLLGLLKENETSFEKFYSYQTKTTLFHTCSSRGQDSDWSASCLSRCFLQLLEDFIGHLKKCVLPNFFIPDQNLLFGIDKKKCLLLARCIEEQRDKDFPIFSCWLQINEE
ncbi:uncharacterized protein LOC133020348 [Limanda limanda]|uniref:uncharacterized protein LOC133020348 n=1 Tax=Limanda limanda TaxID=27771 RepID=UPI0029C6974D|nr:uncharacterized protein LOC133020348 [Limanda limanda]